MGDRLSVGVYLEVLLLLSGVVLHKALLLGYECHNISHVNCHESCSKYSRSFQPKEAESDYYDINLYYG